MNAAALPRLRHPFPELGERLRGRGIPTLVWVAPIALLTLVSGWLKWRALGAPLWIDEGISIGISQHHLTAIPGVLRQDGSPPVYYLLLHIWMSLFGDTASRAHALSVIFAVLGVPAAGWAAWRPFGPRAALIAAGLAALNPLLGAYADEVRMYSLTFLLATLVTGAFLRAFVVGSRRWAVGFGVLLAVLCLTHGWGLFLAFSAIPCFALAVLARPRAERRALLIDGVIAAVVAAVIYAPWIPTQLFQTAHTGAPWSHRPHLPYSIQHAVFRMLGGTIPTLLLLAVGVVGALMLLFRIRSRTLQVGAASALILAGGTLLGGYLLSRYGQPAWALRYMTTVLGPTVVALAALLDSARWVGWAAAAALVIGLWPGSPSTASLSHKENVNQLAAALGGQVPKGTLIASPQPEQVPVIRYYFGPGYRYVTPLGLQRDDRVMNWIDAMKRVDDSKLQATLAPQVRRVRPGQLVLLVQPRFGHADAPWTRAAYRHELEWRHWLEHNPGLRVIARFEPTRYYSRSTVGGELFMRTNAPLS